MCRTSVQVRFVHVEADKDGRVAARSSKSDEAVFQTDPTFHRPGGIQRSRLDGTEDPAAGQRIRRRNIQPFHPCTHQNSGTFGNGNVQLWYSNLP